ncbi:MAG: nicotinate-nucleotide adenylyltransferase [Bacteroidales bacterium]|nr:nicotinate-nucleotide adenylyltransferase [Bacteroidales bacterium]
MKTGLFFGSFNPVHMGHLMIANYMVEFTDLEQIWFVVSPQNPLKKRKNLLNDYERLIMLEQAVEEDERFDVCDIEFSMPKPSYTIDTLTYLREVYPSQEFVLIMGSDGLMTFHKWKNHEIIQQNYQRYVYPRPGFDVDPAAHPNIVLVKAPQIEISSTFIRNAIRDELNIRYFLPAKVYRYILKMHYYEK